MSHNKPKRRVNANIQCKTEKKNYAIANSIRLARGKFELTNQGLVGGKNLTVLTSVEVRAVSI